MTRSCRRWAPSTIRSPSRCLRVSRCRAPGSIPRTSGFRADSCGAPRPARTRSKAASPTTTGRSGSAPAGWPSPQAWRAITIAGSGRTSISRRRWTTTRTVSRSNGAGSNPKKACSRTRRSSTTARCSWRFTSATSNRWSHCSITPFRCGWRRKAGGRATSSRTTSCATSPGWLPSTGISYAGGSRSTSRSCRRTRAGCWASGHRARQTTSRARSGSSAA